MLKIEAANLPFVKFGDSTAARVGDWVVAIGNPFGLGGTVTAGIVSAVHRVTGQGGAYDRFIQTDAVDQQRQFGRPDVRPERQRHRHQFADLFARPAATSASASRSPPKQAKPIIDTLMKGGKIQRGYLGVGMPAGRPTTSPTRSACPRTAAS